MVKTAWSCVSQSDSVAPNWKPGFNIRIKGILMTTPHHFTYLSNSEEIQILHKSVDLAEKDFDRGRIQVKIIIFIVMKN